MSPGESEGEEAVRALDVRGSHSFEHRGLDPVYSTTSPDGHDVSRISHVPSATDVELSISASDMPTSPEGKGQDASRQHDAGAATNRATGKPDVTAQRSPGATALSHHTRELLVYMYVRYGM
jgi:hypothetical protein